MNKHEIDVSKTSFLQSLLHLSFRVLVVESACWDLAREKDIFTLDPRLVDSLAARSFIPIGGGGIDLKSFNKAVELGAFEEEFLTCL
jgi:hypothetical protein